MNIFILRKIVAGNLELILWENLEDVHQYSEMNEPSNPLPIDQNQIDLTESDKIITLPSTSQHYTNVSTASSSPQKEPINLVFCFNFLTIPKTNF